MSLTFVDTNVLVYAHDGANPSKQRIATTLLDSLWEERSGVVSVQVLQEFYVVATRKLREPIPRRLARGVVAAYSVWPVVAIDPPMIVAASTMEERHRISFWDALIVAAAQRAGATSIATEDLQTGRRFAKIAITNPFA